MPRTAILRQGHGCRFPLAIHVCLIKSTSHRLPPPLLQRNAMRLTVLVASFAKKVSCTCAERSNGRAQSGWVVALGSWWLAVGHMVGLAVKACQLSECAEFADGRRGRLVVGTCSLVPTTSVFFFSGSWTQNLLPLHFGTVCSRG